MSRGRGWTTKLSASENQKFHSKGSRHSTSDSVHTLQGTSSTVYRPSKGRSCRLSATRAPLNHGSSCLIHGTLSWLDHNDKWPILTFQRGHTVLKILSWELHQCYRVCCFASDHLVMGGSLPLILNLGASNDRKHLLVRSASSIARISYLRNMDFFSKTPPSPNPPLDFERPAMYLALFVAIVALGDEAYQQHRRRLRAEADLVHARARLTETERQLADQSDESGLLREKSAGRGADPAPSRQRHDHG